MWSSSPLGQDGLGLMGDPASWLLPLEHNRSNKDDFLHPSSQKTMASLFAKEDPILAGKQSPQKVFLGNGQNGGTFSPVTSLSDHDPWLQDTSFPPLCGGNNHFPNKSLDEMSYGSFNGSAGTHPFEPSAANCWPKLNGAAVDYHSSYSVLVIACSETDVDGIFGVIPRINMSFIIIELLTEGMGYARFRTTSWEVIYFKAPCWRFISQPDVQSL
ncbi:hypothetical protein Goarm_012947, partial [Gossypium armourianum]|nr:hypothetical protein [Gossypium armourianum]